MPNTYCAVGVAYGAKVSGNKLKTLKIQLKFCNQTDLLHGHEILISYLYYSSGKKTRDVVASYKVLT